MIAVAEAYRAGLFGRQHFLSNLTAGVIVGVVALPLAMAFAIASGAKPEQGLYTAIVAGFLVSIFGGSRLQIAGPTGAFIVILAAITAKYGIDGLQLATFMAGIMLLAMGAARLGSIIKYIPDPVIVGFTSGIAVIIWVGQWKDFFGLNTPGGAEHFHEKIVALVEALPHFHTATTLIALLSLLLLVVTPRFVKRVPGPLVAMVAATAVQAAFQFPGVETIGSTFGGIPQSLPTFHLPEVSFKRIVELIGPAFTIAMLGAIESLLSAVVADGMAGTKHDSNQELVGQGIANLFAPLLGGFAATGAIARTATNVRNGGNSPLAGIIHAVTLVLIILFLAPLAAYIPLSALAAILFVVSYNMSEIHHFIGMVKRAPRSDVAILLCTFLLTVFADLVVAVNVGVILASLLFMRRMSQSVSVEQVAQSDLAREVDQVILKHLPPGVMVYSIDGPFFFGAAENFERAMKSTGNVPKTLVLRLERVPFMDITGLQALSEMVEDFRKLGTRVIFSEPSRRVTGKLRRAGLLTLVGEENVFADLEHALISAADGLPETERERFQQRIHTQFLETSSKYLGTTGGKC